MGPSPSHTDTPVYGAAMFGLLGEHSADLTTLSSPDGVYAEVSASCKRLLGWDPARLVGGRVDDFVHPEDVEAAGNARRAALASPGVVVSQHRLRRADGDYLWTESAIRAVRDPRWGDEVMLVASVRDIAVRRVAEARLERQALTDPLTGIANRTVFMDRLDHALRRLARRPSVLGVICLDLDRFKVINDSLGHKIGDVLLVKVAERVQRSLRPSDTLARLGGDEFVVLAEDLPAPAEAERLAERICAAAGESFDLHGERFVCTLSAGVATTTDAAHPHDRLLQEADLALYRAKKSGRNRVEVFDEDLRSSAVGRLGIEQMLRLAIAEERLVVQYQPIIDLSAGRLVGAEALVRVRHGEELVPAERFITVAEETGVVGVIDAHVLNRALAQGASWWREFGTGPFAGVSVNVSSRQLADTGFVQVVEDALADTCLPRGALSLEMSERVLLEATSSAMGSVRALRALGVKIGLDDFGTGYSSLAYLRRLPLDFVKIDRSFVHELGRSTQDAAVLAGVVDLAHAIGLPVVAEGVETAHQRGVLTALGCDRAQGFVFSPAVDALALSALISEDRRAAGSAAGPDRPAATAPGARPA